MFQFELKSLQSKTVPIEQDQWLDKFPTEIYRRDCAPAARDSKIAQWSKNKIFPKIDGNIQNVKQRARGERDGVP